MSRKEQDGWSAADESFFQQAKLKSEVSDQPFSITVSRMARRKALAIEKHNFREKLSLDELNTYLEERDY